LPFTISKNISSKPQEEMMKVIKVLLSVGIPLAFCFFCWTQILSPLLLNNSCSGFLSRPKHIPGYFDVGDTFLVTNVYTTHTTPTYCFKYDAYTGQGEFLTDAHNARFRNQCPNYDNNYNYNSRNCVWKGQSLDCPVQQNTKCQESYKVKEGTTLMIYQIEDGEFFLKNTTPEYIHSYYIDGHLYFDFGVTPTPSPTNTPSP
jgi:hypothetical protein